MFQKRAILPALLDHLSKKQVTVLTGMRRTGKTTLLKHLMEQSDIRQKIWFDLERIDNRMLFSEENYENIVFALTQRGLRFSEKILICIDEIQLVPNLPSVVKYLYDTYDLKFILTGSSSYYLKNKFDESLAGRKKIFEIFPLTFSEVQIFKNMPVPKTKFNFEKMPFIHSEYQRLKHLYDEYIDFGGFPEVVLMDSIADKKDLISDILSSYLNIDIASVTDFKRSTDAFKLIKLLAVRIGSKLEISKLASLTGMNRVAVENYIQLFEQSYLLRTIPVTSRSVEREIVKARKIYFLDNGLASMCAELGSGAKFENAVFNQLQHYGEISYFQLKTGNEIDFVLDQKMAIEVKETGDARDLKNAQNLAKSLDIEPCFVVGRHPSHVFDGFIWGGFL
jgi:uncharacterized protein